MELVVTLSAPPLVMEDGAAFAVAPFVDADVLGV